MLQFFTEFYHKTLKTARKGACTITMNTCNLKETIEGGVAKALHPAPPN